MGIDQNPEVYHYLKNLKNHCKSIQPLRKSNRKKDNNKKGNFLKQNFVPDRFYRKVLISLTMYPKIHQNKNG